MRRLLGLTVMAGFAATLPGCYDVPVIPPKPEPAEIVRMNASAEMSREFARKPDLKKDLPKFLEKLGPAETSEQLREAWLSVYPGYPRVINRAIDKSLRDFHWPVAPVTDGRVFVEGFRAAAEEHVAAEPAGQS